jgi:CheY-like chemotaxis protein
MSAPNATALPRVLVVEDEQMLRQSVVAGLSRLSGIEVVGAGSVAEALVEVQRRAPAMVISDIDLPDRSGIELLGEFGARGLKPFVVFVSAYVKAFKAQIPPHAGVQVLEKPVSLEQLRALVTSHLIQPFASSESSPFGVADYLQLASLGHHSVRIDVGGAQGGHVIVVGGEAWSAQDRQGEGLDAFRRMALEVGPVVRCQTLTSEPGPRSLSGTAESLLLECARLQDEGAPPSFSETLNFELSIDEPTLPSPPPPSPEPLPVVAPPVAPVRLSPPAATPVAPARPPQPSAPRPPAASPARPPPPREAPPRTFAEWFDVAVEASLARNHAEALAAFREAQKLEPHDTKVQVNIQRLEKLLARED